MLVNQTVNGAPAKASAMSQLSLDLKGCKDRLLPSCNVNLIDNRHTQDVVFTMDTCICGEQPTMSFPIIIAKSMPVPFRGFVPPPGVPPQPLGNFALEVPAYKNMKVDKLTGMWIM